MWTSAEIAAACRRRRPRGFEVGRVTFDSREVQPGDLFIALKGETTDGHRFLDAAFAAGAAGVLVSAPVGPCVVVADTHALTISAAPPRARTRRRSSASPARSARPAPRRCSPPSTARRRAAPIASEGYNNHTGVPLSVARTPRDARARCSRWA